MKIVILTPEPGGDWAAGRWPRVLEQLGNALREFEVAGRSWVEELGHADLVLPLLAWGYHIDDRRWSDRVARWEQQGLFVLNHPAVLRWNADKSYLARLAGAGAPVTPTLFAERLTDEVLLDAARRFGTDRLVAKPRVSAGAWQTIRWTPGQGFEDGPDGHAMIQPYLPSIESEGEISLIFFDGKFSHAIRKRPQPGDFRVQPEYDGIINAHEPARDELEAAEAALRAVGEDLLYARIDLVRDLEGRPVLMEAELVEPDLYLGFDPRGGAGLGEGMKRRLAR